MIPILGTTKLHRLRENVGAASIELTDDDIREIDEAASHIAVHGERYAASSQMLAVILVGLFMIAY